MGFAILADELLEKLNNLGKVLLPELGHTRDVYGFAILADELLEKLGNLGKVFTARTRSY